MEDKTGTVELTVAEENADRVVIRVAGEVDMATAPSVTAFVHRHLTEGTRTLVLDLDEVTFFGSAGINVLLTLRAEFEVSGTGLGIAARTKAVLRPLELTGLMRLFTLEPSPAETG